MMRPENDSHRRKSKIVKKERKADDRSKKVGDGIAKINARREEEKITIHNILIMRILPGTYLDLYQGTWARTLTLFAPLITQFEW